MAKRTFKLTVKDGDSTYEYDAKTGSYKYGVKDYVVETTDIGDALLQFLEYATDEYNESKVTLSIVLPKKGKKN